MGEKFRSSSETDANNGEKKKLCYDYTLNGIDHVDRNGERQSGQMCFDTDEKVKTLADLLDSEDEKQCLEYIIQARDHVNGGVVSGKLASYASKNNLIKIEPPAITSD